MSRLEPVWVYIYYYVEAQKCMYVYLVNDGIVVLYIIYIYRIYSIRRSGVYSFRAACGGRRLLTQRSLAVCSTVSLCLLLQLYRCSQALICPLSR